MKLQISKTSFPLREELWKSEQQQRNVTICDDLSIVRYDLPQRKGWTLDDFASSKNPLYLYLSSAISGHAHQTVHLLSIYNFEEKSYFCWIEKWSS